MSDTKVSALTALAVAPDATDEFVVVDKSDTSMAASGTDKRITAATLLASVTGYRTVHESKARFTSAGASGSKYWFVPATAEVTQLAPGTAAHAHALMFNFLAADFTVVPLTTKLRLSVVCQTSSTAPTITVTSGLYPVTAGAQATLGTVVANSTVVHTTPAASGTHPATSGDFTIPSDGIHAIGYTLSGTPAGNHFMFAQLQVRNVV